MSLVLYGRRFTRIILLIYYLFFGGSLWSLYTDNLFNLFNFFFFLIYKILVIYCLWFFMVAALHRFMLMDHLGSENVDIRGRASIHGVMGRWINPLMVDQKQIKLKKNTIL